MDQTVLNEKLVELIFKHSYREGDFTLSSGKKSSFYLDLKNVTLHPEGARLIGRLVFEKIVLSDFAAIGGPTLGADPIVTAISLAAFEKGLTLPAFILRKEPKKHGTSQWIEGRENLKSGSRVLVIEDVVTTGGSSLRAIEKIRAEGFVVDTVLTVLDREENGAQNLAAAGLVLVSLSTLSQVLSFAKR